MEPLTPVAVVGAVVIVVPLVPVEQAVEVQVDLVEEQLVLQEQQTPAVVVVDLVMAVEAMVGQV